METCFPGTCAWPGRGHGDRRLRVFYGSSKICILLFGQLPRGLENVAGMGEGRRASFAGGSVSLLTSPYLNKQTNKQTQTRSLERRAEALSGGFSELGRAREWSRSYSSLTL